MNGYADSTLHLQANGRLVLYRPGGFDPSHSTWAIGGFDEQKLIDCVIPGTLTIDIQGGTISQHVDKQIVNNSMTTIGVRDGKQFAKIPPGSSLGVATLGTLNVDAQVFFPEGISSDSRVNEKYGPECKVIYVNRSERGFALTV